MLDSGKEYFPKIGFMQGRLVEKYNSRYQAFPPHSWRQEFELARELKLPLIEFIADYENEDKNPFFLSYAELDSLKEIADKNHLKILSICADYFMKYNLIKFDSFEINLSSFEVLKLLIKNGKYFGIKTIVLPFVDESSIKSIFREPKVIGNLKSIIKLFEKEEIECSFELDLPPDDVLEFVSKFDSEIVKINYDIGNSASLGYDCADELSKYGHLINDIHLKDREINGGPVVFGSGASNFEELFKFIFQKKFSGPIIMQSYRDELGFDIFNQQLNWIKERFL